jgi:hypothetical protein
MNIKYFRSQAKKKKEELSSFLDKLDEVVPEDMPDLVARTEIQVWSKVNCMECANCCKTMTPTFRKADIIRIAAHLKMEPLAFRNKWLKKDEENGDWVNINQPCQFLEDNKCSIYDVRPRDCAEFPHHNKKPFDAYNDTFKNNITHCPATYLLIDRLKKTVERDYEW